MICNTCGYNNAEGSKYCYNCGNQLICLTCKRIINKRPYEPANFCMYCSTPIRRVNYQNTSESGSSDKAKNDIVTDEKQQAPFTSAFNSDNKKAKEHIDSASTEKKNATAAKETDQVSPVADTTNHQTNPAQKSKKQNGAKTPHQQQKNSTKTKETKEKASLSAAKKNDQAPSEQKNKKGNDDKAVFCEPKNRTFVYHKGDYAYAKCVSIEKELYKFYCIDHYSNFYLSESVLKKQTKEDIKLNSYIWVRLKDVIRQYDYCTYKVFIGSFNNLWKESRTFTYQHKVGDIIKAPINKVDKDFLEVCLTPSFTSRIYSINTYSINYREGDIITAIISKINTFDNKVTVELNIVDEDRLNLWDVLPETLSKENCRITGKTRENMKKDRFRGLFDTDNKSHLISQLGSIYKERYEAKQVSSHQNQSHYFMDFYTGKKDSNGVPVHIGFKLNKTEENAVWRCNFVGICSAKKEFEKDVYVKNWQKILNDLSSMALRGEQWDLSGEKEKGKKIILKQYLLFTYYKTKLDDLIYENEHGAVFNTGLVDNSYDNIYCYLKPNENTQDFFERKWEFGFFATWGNISGKGKHLTEWFVEEPKSPEYIKNLKDVFYDTSKTLYPDYNHIIKDNLKRIPVEFLIRCLAHDNKILSLLRRYQDNPSDRQTFEKIEKYIQNDTNSSYTEIQEKLKLAVEKAKKYCKWNYKTAIPIYYPRINGISLLLPLCLNNKGDNSADVALVIEKAESGNYQGETILTLNMAYQDARLICRPNSEWLTPDLISASDEDNDIDDED